MKHTPKKLALSLCVAAAIGNTGQAHAAEIMFGYVGSKHHSYGQSLASMLSSMAGYNVTQRNLWEATYNDLNQFDQIWVYDLSDVADNSANQTANYANIANWYNTRQNQNIILDGRIISSSGYAGKPQETQLIQNYATVMNQHGGGLMLGTDHNVYHSGINQINAQIGIDAFHGNFYQPPYQAVVDPNSALMANNAAGTCVDPNITEGCIWDHSSTGFVATGMQANGQMLTPVAYHGFVADAWDQAAVSASFGSVTFGTAPEPSAIALTGLGLGMVAFGARRKKRAAKA